ncbi:MAG: hypothetical protein EOO07_20960 [Chitinophagaceae bacterium]|nr:MAG: hypothetical protein EOO07_20960 [Chitinophagaceae bacterium]
MEKVCIYPKDIEVVTGKSERKCRYMLNDMKVFYKKEKHQVITLEEFCSYMGLEIEVVRRILKQHK